MYPYNPLAARAPAPAAAGAAGAGAVPPAFPLLTPIAYPNAYRRNMIAATQVNLTPGAVMPRNRREIARAVEGFAGLSRGAASVRQAPGGSIYVEAHTPVIEGWGGELYRTHLSAHPPNGRGSAIGTTHVKTTRTNARAPGGEAPVYEARIIPNLSHNRPPNFTRLVTPLPSARRGMAYPEGSREALVARGTANAFTRYAREHPAPRRGGRTYRKKSKKSRKGKTHRH